MEKTANKRGRTSWIWDYGAEVREVNKPPAKKPHWVGKLCWDQKRTFLKGMISTTPAIDHLAECHGLNSDGPIIATEPSVLEQVVGRALGGDGEGKNRRHISQLTCLYSQSSL
jgi:hypothetical protein